MIAGNGRAKPLKGWKGIAAYLGMHEDTVKKLVKKSGLPVHRGPRGTRIIFGLPNEIDSWIADQPTL